MTTLMTPKLPQGRQHRPGASNRQIQIVDCPACGAGNRSLREACFNCGSLLSLGTLKGPRGTEGRAAAAMPEQQEHQT